MTDIIKKGNFLFSIMRRFGGINQPSIVNIKDECYLHQPESSFQIFNLMLSFLVSLKI